MASSSAEGAGLAAAMMLAPQDNVAVALRPLRAGETIAMGGATLVVERDTAVGHKLAARPIAAGETIIKYNCPIGRATRAITPGAYVHTHNVESSYLPTYTLPA